MSENQIGKVLEALDVLGRRGMPEPLIPLAQQLLKAGEEVSVTDLEAWLSKSVAGDPLVTLLGQVLSRWDGEKSGDWLIGTAPNSLERRERIYELMDLSSEARRLVSHRRPVYASVSSVVEVAFERWLTPSIAKQHEFYWPQYRNYLSDRKGWSEQTVSSLDQASTEIVERLANPTGDVDQAQRGLVVGYVQSGKTANMAAVIAKAIDSGYRLVIVLTGLHEALRRQTQRRLDMELLGMPNILQGLSGWEAKDHAAGEYLQEPAWVNGEFSDLCGSLPSPSIIRLTSFQSDFNPHQTSGLSLRDPGMLGEVYAPENLFALSARIAVVKKNSTILGHLLTALRQNRSSIAHLPALIIDDESDQASVNTAKRLIPAKESEDEQKERKAINDKISSILGELKRGQYVGYTATPFANVFIDPADLEDIFPRHFIVSLNEPIGYMGPSSFFNSVQPPVPEYALSNFEAYIRSLRALDSEPVEQDFELLDAIATYVVTGAIKLFRERKQPSLARNYRHHTMLVHEEAGKASHKNLRDRIVQIWRKAQWDTDSGHEHLKRAFDDLRPTLEDRRDESAPFVDDFLQILPFVREVVQRIETESGGVESSPERTVMIVNSDKEIGQKLDFDHHSTWKIVVGGAILSRGFTIEGLTVSYFRRSPKAQDTLLQMGRWFGYRPGYRDLVRVYLATNTAISKRQLVNLYDAFNAMAQTESEFRQQLSIYSEWTGDQPGITPEEVVPLVQQSLPWLKPTAPNKMQNARIVSQQTAVFSPKGQMWSAKAVADNWIATQKLVEVASEPLTISQVSLRRAQTPSWLGIASVDEIVAALRQTKYLDDYGDRVVEPNAAYYEACRDRGSLSDFLVIFPQLIKREDIAGILEIPGLGARTLVTRTRNPVKGNQYGEFTSDVHREIAMAFVSQDDNLCPPELKELRVGATRGAVLCYIFPEKGVTEKPLEAAASLPASPILPSQCVVGPTIYLPGMALAASNGSRITWQSVHSGK